MLIEELNSNAHKCIMKVWFSYFDLFYLLLLILELFLVSFFFQCIMLSDALGLKMKDISWDLEQQRNLHKVLAEELKRILAARDRLLNQIQDIRQTRFLEGFSHFLKMAAMIYPDLDLSRIPFSTDELNRRRDAGWEPTVPTYGGAPIVLLNILKSN